VIRRAAPVLGRRSFALQSIWALRLLRAGGRPRPRGVPVGPRGEPRGVPRRRQRGIRQAGGLHRGGVPPGVRLAPPRHGRAARPGASQRCDAGLGPGAAPGQGCRPLVCPRRPAHQPGRHAGSPGGRGGRGDLPGQPGRDPHRPRRGEACRGVRAGGGRVHPPGQPGRRPTAPHPPGDRQPHPRATGRLAHPRQPRPTRPPPGRRRHLPGHLSAPADPHARHRVG
jgi:hypothetical protein